MHALWSPVLDAPDLQADARDGMRVLPAASPRTLAATGIMTGMDRERSISEHAALANGQHRREGTRTNFALPSETEAAARRLAGYQVRTRSAGEGQHDVLVDDQTVERISRESARSGGYRGSAEDGAVTHGSKSKAIRQAVVDHDVKTHGLRGMTPAHRAYIES